MRERIKYMDKILGLVEVVIPTIMKYLAQTLIVLGYLLLFGGAIFEKPFLMVVGCFLIVMNEFEKRRIVNITNNNNMTTNIDKTIYQSIEEKVLREHGITDGASGSGRG